MLKRTITGFFILVAVIGFLILKQFSDLIFDALILIIMYCSLYETIKVYKLSNKEIDYSLYLIPAILCVIFNLETNTFKAVGYVLALSVLFVMFLLTSEIVLYAVRRKKNENETDPAVLNQKLFDRTKNTMQIYAYPTIVLSFMFALNHLGFEISYIGLIFAFATSMLTDTFAYLFGRTFGKRKFIPEVSPNKTIAGLIGGFVGGIVSAVLCLLAFSYFEPFASFVAEKKDLFILVFAILGIIGALADQLGDLVASAQKRKVGVKDYAQAFPGHGGFMDRVDGLMFTMFVTFISFALFLV